MAKLSKSKGSSVPQIGLEYLVDSDQFCGIFDCGMMAQASLHGASQDWLVCKQHLIDLLSEWEVFELVEE